MASSLVQSNKTMKRLESRKSHSWWWDSHIGPKNSRWLADNLDEMDKSVKHMLKLIEEDGDSFAKKAEMYYQKRPELVANVEEFYRMYRSLAERYDHLTGELQKNVPSDLQSQGSGISDIGSEPPSFCPSPDQKITRRKSGPRAAGFEFFLGSGGNSSDVYPKEGDDSSSSSDSGSDDSSVNNYSVIRNNIADQELQRKLIELETELRDVKEKLRIPQEDSIDGSSRRSQDQYYEDLLARIAGYEQDLRAASEKILSSEEEITRLKNELQKYETSEYTNGFFSQKVHNTHESEVDLNINQDSKLQENIARLELQASDPNDRVRMLEEELRITKDSLRDSEKEIARLRHELESNRSSAAKIQQLQVKLEQAEKDTAVSKAKLNAERREVSKLQERIARLKTSLSDRDHEVRDLKIAVSDAEEKIFPEKSQIKAEISKLLEERTSLEHQLREWESRGRTLEEEMRNARTEKTETEERLRGEVEQLNVDVAERSDEIRKLKSEIISLKSEMSRKDERYAKMEKHLQEMHMEHAELIARMEEAGTMVEKVRLRVKELEQEVEKQRVMIMEGAEEKREAIRQLCFSLEHYRNGYQSLRRAFRGQRQVQVC